MNKGSQLHRESGVSNMAKFSFQNSATLHNRLYRAKMRINRNKGSHLNKESEVSNEQGVPAEQGVSGLY